jgi:hypothetical protein
MIKKSFEAYFQSNLLLIKKLSTGFKSHFNHFRPSFDLAFKKQN